MFKNLFWQLRDFPVLETPRLTLRQLLPRDKDDMFEYAQNPEITKYLLWYEHENVQFTAKYLKYLQPRYRRGEYHDWAIVNNEENKMIGTAGFVTFDTENNAAEIGYVISHKYHNLGYATEAVKRIINFGFEELALNRIFARHIAGNDASGRVMQKCGMTFEGIQRSSMYIKERYRDIALYAITREDYFGN
ncbi:MAG: GNAT family N-acetyltransferase [Ruminococcaceae bacterium]|nr:GNAT family N-acetyltransferase [Oscillospiraceae bacterium]